MPPKAIEIEISPSRMRALVTVRPEVGVIPKGAQIWRRPEVCLQALSSMPTKRYLAVFTGGADYEVVSLLDKAKTMGIADRILWVQELPSSKITAMYTHSVVVISVAKRQGFGLIPLEALLCGAPSIVSLSSGVSEVLRDGVEAMIVHDESPEELTEALNKLISNPELRRNIVLNGQRKVLEEFTSIQFVQRFKEQLLALP